MRIYFAHPMAHYNSAYEAECMAEIGRKFPGVEIVNPNHWTYQESYEKAGGKGMEFWNALAESCDMLVAVPFRDGEHGSGVWKEMEAMQAKRGLVLELHKGKWRTVDFADIRPLSVTETRFRTRMLKEGNL
jgi:hypothetical protein